MCQAECVGDYHRGCQHYVKLYDTGVVIDCGSPSCALSRAHSHSARSCQCKKEYTEKRKVQNLIQTQCEACRAAAWASLDPHNERQW